MKETPETLEYRKVLDSILQEGSYHNGHIMILESIAAKRVQKLQETIKEALGVRE